MLKTPVKLILPERTLEPLVTSCGTDSPVRAVVSRLERPSSTIPSSGIFSPGFTKM